MERIKLRIRCNMTGEVYIDETEGELAFEINGYRFFFHDGRISDALCGMVIGFGTVAKAGYHFIKNFKRDKHNV